MTKKYNRKQMHRGKITLVHRIIAEEVLRKPLPETAVIHHVNGNPYDNRKCNLVICEDQAYHNLLHKRERILRFGGNPNTQQICAHCKKLMSLDEMSKSTSLYCKSCNRKTNKLAVERYRKKIQ